MYAAFDLGLRHGEIVKVQLKHVNVKPIKVAIDGEVREVLAIALPPAVTKGGKTTGEMEYVYAGTETGRPVKTFKRMWRELFKLAGLDYGRAKDLTWHTIRHEFVSRNIENTGDPVVTQRLARHKDGRTTQGYMHARESRVMAAVVRLNQ